MSAGHRLRYVAALALIVAAWHGILPSHASPLQPRLRPHARHGLVPLAVSVSPAIRTARPLGSVAARTSLSVEIRLRLQHVATLQRLLHDLYTPGSHAFHHFLTSRQFAARFAPSHSAEQQIERWLQQSRLHVAGRFRNGLLLTVSGAADDIERAFHTSLARYRLGSGAVIANTRPAEIPATLAADVAGVGGLSPSILRRPLGLVRRSDRESAPAEGFSPQDISRLYDLTPLSNRALDGGGETVALIEFADYDSHDLSSYASAYGLSPGPVERIAVGDGHDTGADLGGADQAEAELDVDLVHAVAPAARVLVYEAPNTDDGALAMWNRVLSDDRASVISTSWGAPESLISPDEVDGFDAMNAIAQEAAAQGQTILAASGDRGAYDAAGNKDATPTQQGSLSVDFPASNPWVTGVGGTTLTRAPGDNYGGEVAWSDHEHTPAHGSGGGLSAVYPRPEYQTGPGLATSNSNGMRQTPDVAADADTRTGFAIYTIPGDDKTSPEWLLVGGTSASAPLWAGIVALAAQDRGKSLGFLNPALYALGAAGSSAFHDVTSGDNLYYAAGAGWDFATGWGSPDGARLVAALRGYAAPPVPTPTATSTATPTQTPTATTVPTATAFPTATETATPAPIPTAMPSPTPLPLPLDARFAHANLKRGATQTITVLSAAGVRIDLQIRYPGGKVLTVRGITDALGRWRHAWTVRSRHLGPAHVTVTVSFGARRQASTLDFVIA